MVPMHLVRMSWMPADLDDGADRAAGDDARSRRRRAEEHLAGAEVTEHLVRDGAADERDLEQVLACACSLPLRMASGTSLALPRPTPTWPLSSPTTTSAEKQKRRPPLTTLATRLMWTTRSLSSSRLVDSID